jgi:hypothetical protein
MLATRNIVTNVCSTTIFIVTAPRARPRQSSIVDHLAWGCVGACFGIADLSIGLSGHVRVTVRSGVVAISSRVSIRRVGDKAIHIVCCDLEL